MQLLHTPLASADEIREIARSALKVLEAAAEVDDFDPDTPGELIRRSHRWYRAGVEALRFCARAAALLGDPSLLPIVAEALEAVRRFNDEAPNDVVAIAQGLTSLLGAGAAVTDDVRALARHVFVEVRQAVAAGLSGRDLNADAAAGVLLTTLAADPSPEVRAAAKSALGGARDVPWWIGMLAEDPARHAPDAALKALQRIADILDARSFETDRGKEELAALLRALPDPLSVEVVERLLVSANTWGIVRIPALGAILLDREGGVPALARLCARWVETGLGSIQAPHVIRHMLDELLPDRRAAICLELATHALAAEPEARRDFRGPMPILARAAAEAWPPREDLTPLLDALLAAREEPADAGAGLDCVVHKLAAAFQRDDVNPGPILRRAIEARVAGYPGAVAPLGPALDALLDRAAHRLIRPAARRALRSEDEDTRAWAIERLTGRFHSPHKDGPPAETMRRFFADPRLRSAILASHELTARALPLLRAELREGRLDLDGARRTIEAIASLHGGLADSGYVEGRADEELAERRARREQLSAFLGPPELAGPPTDAEWDAYRAARARHPPDDDQTYSAALSLLPEGPWHPDDRALLERAVSAARLRLPYLAFSLSAALAAKSDARDLPLMDELCRIDAADPGVRRCRDLLREKLGLPQATPEPGAAAPRAQADWMDEAE